MKLYVCPKIVSRRKCFATIGDVTLTNTPWASQITGSSIP